MVSDVTSNRRCRSLIHQIVSASKDLLNGMIGRNVSTKLDREDGEVQVSILIYTLNGEAENIFGSFTFFEEDQVRCILHTETECYTRESLLLSTCAACRGKGGDFNSRSL